MMFPRRLHRETYPEARKIAEIMVAPAVWRPVHEKLHANVSIVPMLGFRALQMIAKDIRSSYDDPFEAIGEYCDIADNVAQRPSISDIEQRLIALHVEALQRQVPFLEQAKQHQVLDTVA
ncbi:hypothetical protein CR983_01880 [Candidatus Saccharibacteria bacterium]|nr:MAG: hypothetical protein CR983_01880 [Candidatus Saccharibacteria bacterium]